MSAEGCEAHDAVTCPSDIHLSECKVAYSVIKSSLYGKTDRYMYSLRLTDPPQYDRLGYLLRPNRVEEPRQQRNPDRMPPHRSPYGTELTTIRAGSSPKLAKLLNSPGRGPKVYVPLGSSPG